MKFVLALCILSIALFAAQKDYMEGLEYYKKGEYEKAFPIILKEAQQENRAAQYRLAEMYENGRGTKIDYQQAMYWYKLSSNRYSYIETDRIEDVNASYLTTVRRQIGDDSIRKGYEYSLAKMDTNTPETRQLVKSITGGGFFGLQPHQTNFFLPVSYAKDKYQRRSAALPDEKLNQLFSEPQYDKNTEVEFQLSLRKQLSYDLFGLNEFIYFAYTQKVWWQLYEESGPFRETNYLPEMYMTIPTTQYWDNLLGLKAVKLGFIHESNGQEGYRSRSWNRIYATGMWQWGNWFLATRAWYRLNEGEKSDAYYDGQLGIDEANEKGDDNPDIQKYLGYGDIKIDYLNGKSQFGLLLRNNLRFNSDNKGAVEFSWSYPFLGSPNTFWYAKVFHGYGESLIDYDQEVTKTSFGFSFSRGLF